MEHPPESLSALIQTWHDQRGVMRARAVQWISSAAFREVFYDDAHPPLAAKILVSREMERKAAAVFRRNAGVFGLQTPELLKQYKELARCGVLVFGQVVIVNPDCADKPNQNLPCIVLVPEDQSPTAVAEARELADWLGEIYAGLVVDEPALTKLLQDDEFKLFRRRTLPGSGKIPGDVHLLDLAVRFTWLPPDMSFIPLLIQPGRKGAAVQIPWSIAAGTPPVPGSMQRGIWGDFADLDQEADRMVAQQDSRRGCFFWFQRVVGIFFLLVLVLGLIGYLMK